MKVLESIYLAEKIHCMDKVVLGSAFHISNNNAFAQFKPQEDQRNGRNKEHPSSYPTVEEQMAGHLTRLPIQHPAQRAYNKEIQWPQNKRTPPKDLDSRSQEILSLYDTPPAQAF